MTGEGWGHDPVPGPAEGMGGDPWEGALPAISPEDPRDAVAAPRRRRWYHAPGTLVGASTFTAVSAWVALLFVSFAWLLGAMIAESGGLGFLLVLVLWPVLLIIGIAALVAGVLALTGAVATVPLIVLWFRSDERPAGPGFAVIHAVVACAAVVITLVRLL